MKKLNDCPDCATLPGRIHDPGCDIERCSVCGSQWISCGCKGHDRVFARWTGIWPGEAEAKHLGIDMNQLYEKGVYKALFVKPIPDFRRTIYIRLKGKFKKVLQELLNKDGQETYEIDELAITPSTGKDGVLEAEDVEIIGRERHE